MQRSVLSLVFSIALVLAAGACAFYAWTWNAKTGEQAHVALGLSSLEDALLKSLVQTQTPAGPIEIAGSANGHAYRFMLKSDQVVTLTRLFASCETYPSEDCGYKVKFVFDPKRMSYSYEVTSAYSQAPMSLKAEGRDAIVRPPTSLPAGSSLACDSRNALAANGYSTTTGLSCLLKPEAICKPGTLPRGIEVTGAVPRLEFVCGEPSKIARCPAQYSLEKIDTRTLGMERKTEATCVRTTLASISPEKEVAPAGRISGRVCPYGYKSDSLCQIVNVIAKPGRCGGKGPAIQPVAGKVEFIQNATVGFVDCAVRKRTQSCGAQWSADVQLKIRCVLDQPERIDVQ